MDEQQEAAEQPAVAPVPEQYATGATPPPQPKKKRGCLKWGCGCLAVLLVVVLLGVSAIGWYLRWPEQWGLIDSPGDELFAVSPNPFAADALETEMVELNYPLDGLTFYVMPRDGGDYHIVYVLAQEAEGFTWTNETWENPIEGLLIITAATETAAAWRIEQIAVDYRDSSGNQVAVMTAPRQAIIDYAVGTITQEQLFDQMHGRTPDSTSLDISTGGE